MVEQLFRKQQAVGSIPTVGSTPKAQPCAHCPLFWLGGDLLDAAALA